TMKEKIAQMAVQLEPIVEVLSNEPHPACPKSLLGLFLLTEAEIDSMAHFYGQSTPHEFTRYYPGSMTWDKEYFAACK
ncbi:hypothetical protein BDY21DRAFT_270216, partial [Lineolata rhizophorae]